MDIVGSYENLDVYSAVWRIDESLTGIASRRENIRFFCAIQTDFIQPGDGCGRRVMLFDKLVRCLLACPERPQDGVPVMGTGYKLLLRVAEDAVNESRILTLPHILRIGQIHNIVAYENQNNLSPFVPCV